MNEIHQVAVTVAVLKQCQIEDIIIENDPVILHISLTYKCRLGRQAVLAWQLHHVFKVVSDSCDQIIIDTDLLDHVQKPVI